MFSRARFRRYAIDLSRAVEALDHEVKVRDQYGIRYHTLGPHMSITGLQQGSIQAKLAEIKHKAQARQAAGIAKIEAKHSEGLAKVDAAMDDVARKIDKEVDATLQEFAEFTNGGPLLDDAPTSLPIVNIAPDHPREDTGAVDRIALSRGETPIPS